MSTQRPILSLNGKKTKKREITSTSLDSKTLSLASAKPALAVNKSAKQVGDVTTKKIVEHTHPPATLVSTWIWMMQESREKDVKELGQSRIKHEFGSLYAAIEYVDSQG
jgi:hypothetical protein